MPIYCTVLDAVYIQVPTNTPAVEFDRDVIFVCVVFPIFKVHVVRKVRIREQGLIHDVQKENYHCTYFLNA